MKQKRPSNRKSNESSVNNSPMKQIVKDAINNILQRNQIKMKKIQNRKIEKDFRGRGIR